jgi:hypothetical protein
MLHGTCCKSLKQTPWENLCAMKPDAKETFKLCSSRCVLLPFTIFALENIFHKTTFNMNMQSNVIDAYK